MKVIEGGDKMFNCYTPTRLIFGTGTINELSSLELPGKRALIVTTSGLSVKKYGYLDKVIVQLEEKGIEVMVYDQVSPNPMKNEIEDGGNLCKDKQVDFIVGLGGGSAIDAAKAIAVMSTNPGDYWDYIQSGTGRKKQFMKKPLPVIAITTTAGTGTEVDPWMVVTKTETNEKTGMGNADTFPMVAIVDPELTCSIPPRLTAYQGFDALFHSIEGYLNRKAYILSDLYALEAIRRVSLSLADAVKDGNNITARENISLANTLSGLVESTSGCIGEHALAHAMSGIHPELEHGAALLSVCIPYYTYLAHTNQCEERMVKMAQAMGNPTATTSMDFVRSLEALMKACNVADIKMSEYGIQYDNLLDYVQHARFTMGKLFAVDPIEFSDEALLSILEAGYR